MTQHAPYALMFGTVVLAYGKTTKTACGKRRPTDKLVRRDQTDCPDCISAIAADAALHDEVVAAAEAIRVQQQQEQQEAQDRLLRAIFGED